MLTSQSVWRAAPADRTMLALAPNWKTRLRNVLTLWAERRAYRRNVAALGDRLLRDIGITREQARREYTKPVWR